MVILKTGWVRAWRTSCEGIREQVTIGECGVRNLQLPEEKLERGERGATAPVARISVGPCMLEGMTPSCPCKVRHELGARGWRFLPDILALTIPYS